MSSPHDLNPDTPRTQLAISLEGVSIGDVFDIVKLADFKDNARYSPRIAELRFEYYSTRQCNIRKQVADRRRSLIKEDYSKGLFALPETTAEEQGGLVTIHSKGEELKEFAARLANRSDTHKCNQQKYLNIRKHNETWAKNVLKNEMKRIERFDASFKFHAKMVDGNEQKAREERDKQRKRQEARTARELRKKMENDAFLAQEREASTKLYAENLENIRIAKLKEQEKQKRIAQMKKARADKVIADEEERRRRDEAAYQHKVEKFLEMEENDEKRRSILAKSKQDIADNLRRIADTRDERARLGKQHVEEITENKRQNLLEKMRLDGEKQFRKSNELSRLKEQKEERRLIENILRTMAYDTCQQRIQAKANAVEDKTSYLDNRLANFHYEKQRNHELWNAKKELKQIDRNLNVTRQKQREDTNRRILATNLDLRAAKIDNVMSLRNSLKNEEMNRTRFYKQLREDVNGQFVDMQKSNKVNLSKLRRDLRKTP